eukprot:g4540.t1
MSTRLPTGIRRTTCSTTMRQRILQLSRRTITRTPMRSMLSRINFIRKRLLQAQPRIDNRRMAQVLCGAYTSEDSSSLDKLFSDLDAETERSEGGESSDYMPLAAAPLPAAAAQGGQKAKRKKGELKQPVLPKEWLTGGGEATSSAQPIVQLYEPSAQFDPDTRRHQGQHGHTAPGFGGPDPATADRNASRMGTERAPRPPSVPKGGSKKKTGIAGSTSASAASAARSNPPAPAFVSASAGSNFSKGAGATGTGAAGTSSSSRAAANKLKSAEVHVKHYPDSDRLSGSWPYPQIVFNEKTILSTYAAVSTTIRQRAKKFRVDENTFSENISAARAGGAQQEFSMVLVTEVESKPGANDKIESLKKGFRGSGASKKVAKATAVKAFLEFMGQQSGYVSEADRLQLTTAAISTMISTEKGGRAVNVRTAATEYYTSWVYDEEEGREVELITADMRFPAGNAARNKNQQQLQMFVGGFNPHQQMPMNASHEVHPPVSGDGLTKESAQLSMAGPGGEQCLSAGPTILSALVKLYNGILVSSSEDRAIVEMAGRTTKAGMKKFAKQVAATNAANMRSCLSANTAGTAGANADELAEHGGGGHLGTEEGGEAGDASGAGSTSAGAASGVASASGAPLPLAGGQAAGAAPAATQGGSVLFSHSDIDYWAMITSQRHVRMQERHTAIVARRFAGRIIDVEIERFNICQADIRQTLPLKLDDSFFKQVDLVNHVGEQEERSSAPGLENDALYFGGSGSASLRSTGMAAGGRGQPAPGFGCSLAPKAMSSEPLPGPGTRTFGSGGGPGDRTSSASLAAQLKTFNYCCRIVWPDRTVGPRCAAETKAIAKAIAAEAMLQKVGLLSTGNDAQLEKLARLLQQYFIENVSSKSAKAQLEGNGEMKRPLGVGAAVPAILPVGVDKLLNLRYSSTPAGSGSSSSASTQQQRLSPTTKNATSATPGGASGVYAYGGIGFGFAPEHATNVDPTVNHHTHTSPALLAGVDPSGSAQAPSSGITIEILLHELEKVEPDYWDLVLPGMFRQFRDDWTLLEWCRTRLPTGLWLALLEQSVWLAQPWAEENFHYLCLQQIHAYDEVDEPEVSVAPPENRNLAGDPQNGIEAAESSRLVGGEHEAGEECDSPSGASGSSSDRDSDGSSSESDATENDSGEDEEPANLWESLAAPSESEKKKKAKKKAVIVDAWSFLNEDDDGDDDDEDEDPAPADAEVVESTQKPRKEKKKKSSSSRAARTRDRLDALFGKNPSAAAVATSSSSQMRNPYGAPDMLSSKKAKRVVFPSRACAVYAQKWLSFLFLEEYSSYTRAFEDPGPILVKIIERSFPQMRLLFDRSQAAQRRSGSGPVLLEGDFILIQQRPAIVTKVKEDKKGLLKQSQAASESTTLALTNGGVGGAHDSTILFGAAAMAQQQLALQQAELANPNMSVASIRLLDMQANDKLIFCDDEYHCFINQFGSNVPLKRSLKGVKSLTHFPAKEFDATLPQGFADWLREISASIPLPAIRPPNYVQPTSIDPDLSQLRATYSASQREAISKSWKRRFSMIQGPPGTGKTVCAASLAAMWVLSHDRGQVLCCADSNVAADNLYTAINNVLPEHPFPSGKTWEDLVVRVGDGTKLVQEKIDEKQKYRIIKNARILVTTCVGSGMDLLEPNDLRLLIVDEATQSLETSTLVAMTAAGGNLEQAILVGDHKQLPPTVLSRCATQMNSKSGGGITDYYGSLMARLIEEFMVAGRAMPPSFVPGRLQSALIGTRHLRIDMEPYMLLEQRRMLPMISEFPNETFYFGRLIDHDCVLERAKAVREMSFYFRTMDHSDEEDWGGCAGGLAKLAEVIGKVTEGGGGDDTTESRSAEKDSASRNRVDLNRAEKKMYDLLQTPVEFLDVGGEECKRGESCCNGLEADMVLAYFEEQILPLVQEMCIADMQTADKAEGAEEDNTSRPEPGT